MGGKATKTFLDMAREYWSVHRFKKEQIDEVHKSA